MSCLIADELHHSFSEMMERAGIEYDYRPDISRDEIKEIIGGYSGMIIRSKTQVDADLLKSAKNLQYIARAGAGTDNIDAQYLRSNGIKLLNAPEGNRDAVGDHTLALILALTNHLVKSDAEVRSGIWDREGNRGIELNSQVIAVIGYGNAGRAVVERLSSFGCEVLVYDKYKPDPEDPRFKWSSMDEVFRGADLITFHIPLTPETHHMVTDEYLSKFKKNLRLINASRGEILDTKALVKGLNSGKILGASLDVLENEKINKLSGEALELFEYLQKSNKTILTPHIGGWSFESYERINQVLIRKIKDFVDLKDSDLLH